MTDTPSTTKDVDLLPDTLSGSTVLVAYAGDPSQSAVSLRILGTRGEGTDAAFVVTTTAGVDQTMATYENIGTHATRPSLGIIDTVSEQQSISALYDETPVIFSPSPGDLERLVIALSELSENMDTDEGDRHLVVRSLSPILAAAPIDHVETVLERITGLQSASGLCLLGFDYTAHDGDTMRAVADHVDGILWISQTATEEIDFEYQSLHNQISPRHQTHK
jgi:hypothetical protein